ncbi:shikimate kinase [Lacibacterium aquatile]|uniref:Shikimate kinase n=1 Tax=Lacibacterium aquatile TaxID=1168082 RepID=A0ABW5DNG3_9PROT
MTSSPHIELTLDRPIVLVGLMGCGKSSIGKRLAMRAGIPFRDADVEIEAAAGLTVSEIFERHGEQHFREGERRVIARLLEEPPHILATGGGAFMDASTRAKIKESGLSVWLKVDLDELVRRTARRNTRPLLKNGDPRETLGRLIDLRYPTYAEADITVEGSAQDHDEMVMRVANAIRDYQKPSL